MTVTPVCFTSFGRRAWAVETRFCTSTAATSMLRLGSNVTVIWLDPSFELTDVMYLIPSTPLIACSSGVVTELSTTSELAPV